VGKFAGNYCENFEEILDVGGDFEDVEEFLGVVDDVVGVLVLQCTLRLSIQPVKI
jgi:hypothetical protein